MKFVEFSKIFGLKFFLIFFLNCRYVWRVRLRPREKSRSLRNHFTPWLQSYQNHVPDLRTLQPEWLAQPPKSKSAALLFLPLKAYLFFHRMFSGWVASFQIWEECIKCPSPNSTTSTLSLPRTPKSFCIISSLNSWKITINKSYKILVVSLKLFSLTCTQDLCVFFISVCCSRLEKCVRRCWIESRAQRNYSVLIRSNI